MRAMILAAGRGERMRPLTDHTPKPLLRVNGKPLIVWHIVRLQEAGINEIVINHAYLGSQIEEVLGDGSEWGVQIRYSPETVALETAGGIAFALPLLQANGCEDSPFLVVNGDIFTDFDFASLHLVEGQLAHVVLVDNPAQHPQGDFAIAQDQLVESGEPMLTFSGIGVYHPVLFNSIKQGEAAKLAPLLRLAIHSKQVTARRYQGVWHDIGTPERLAAINFALDQHVNDI